MRTPDGVFILAGWLDEREYTDWVGVHEFFGTVAPTYMGKSV
jgi:hypothetical protein